MIQKNNSRKQFFGLVHSKYLCQHNGEKKQGHECKPSPHLLTKGVESRYVAGVLCSALMQNVLL